MQSNYYDFTPFCPELMYQASEKNSNNKFNLIFTYFNSPGYDEPNLKYRNYWRFECYDDEYVAYVYYTEDPTALTGFLEYDDNTDPDNYFEIQFTSYKYYNWPMPLQIYNDYDYDDNNSYCHSCYPCDNCGCDECINGCWKITCNCGRCITDPDIRLTFTRFGSEELNNDNNCGCNYCQKTMCKCEQYMTNNEYDYYSDCDNMSEMTEEGEEKEYEDEEPDNDSSSDYIPSDISDNSDDKTLIMFYSSKLSVKEAKELIQTLLNKLDRCTNKNQIKQINENLVNLYRQVYN